MKVALPRERSLSALARGLPQRVTGPPRVGNRSRPHACCGAPSRCSTPETKRAPTCCWISASRCATVASREAERVLAHSLVAAVDSDSSVLVARAEIEIEALRAVVDPTASIEQGEAVAQRALEVFKAAGDEAGLALALTTLPKPTGLAVTSKKWRRSWSGRSSSTGGRWTRAHRRAPGHRTSRRSDPRPVHEAVERCRMVLDASQGDVPLTAITEAMLAVLFAMRGDDDEGRALSEQSQRRVDQLGLHVHAALQLMYRAFVESSRVASRRSPGSSCVPASCS